MLARRGLERHIEHAKEAKRTLKKSSAQLGSLHAATGGPEAWQRLSEAISENLDIIGLILNNNNLGELERPSFELFANMIEDSRTIQQLDLASNNLLAMDLGKGVHDGNRECWTLLLGALRKNQSIRDLSLRDNNLAALTDPGWKAFVRFIAENKEVHFLSLRQTMLNKLSVERWEMLARAIQKNSTLESINFRGNDVHGLSRRVKCVLASGFLQHTSLTTVNGAEELTSVLGPFAHAPKAPWQPVFATFKEFRVSLLYGIFPFSLSALLRRVFYLTVCIVVFLLPRWIGDWEFQSLRESALRRSLRELDAALLSALHNGTDASASVIQLLSQGAAVAKLSAGTLAVLAEGITQNASISAVFNDDTLAATASSNATDYITLGALGQLCTHVPSSLNHVYVNAVSGYSILLASYVGLMMYKRARHNALKRTEKREGGWSLEEWAQKPPCGRCKRAVASAAGYARRRLVSAEEGSVKSDPGGQKEEQLRNASYDAKQKSFYLLIQALCTFNALGYVWLPNAALRARSIALQCSPPSAYPQHLFQSQRRFPTDRRWALHACVRRDVRVFQAARAPDNLLRDGRLRHIRARAYAHADDGDADVCHPDHRHLLASGGRRAVRAACVFCVPVLRPGLFGVVLLLRVRLLAALVVRRHWHVLLQE